MPLTDPETLARVGAQLRARRYEIGMTLEELSTATTIRIRYLSAIERGEPGELPGDAYLKGFVRVYAERVGLDAGALLGDEAAAEPDAGGVPGDRIGHRHRRAWRATRRTWVAGVALAVLVVIVVLATRHRSTPPARTAAAPPSAAVHHAVAPPPTIPLTVEPTRVSGGVVAYRVSGASAITVRAHTTGRCWVAVRADGKPVLTRTLAAGTDATWRAKGDLTVDVGDFATIRFTVDGIPLGPLHYRSPSTLDFRLAPSAG